MLLQKGVRYLFTFVTQELKGAKFLNSFFAQYVIFWGGFRKDC